MSRRSWGDLAKKKPIKEISQKIEPEKEIDIKPAKVEKPKVKVIPKPKIKRKPKVEEIIRTGDKYDPRITWYRSTVELLTGTSCRKKKVESIDLIIKELEKKKAEEIERIEKKKKN